MVTSLLVFPGPHLHGMEDGGTGVIGRERSSAEVMQQSMESIKLPTDADWQMRGW